MLLDQVALTPYEGSVLVEGGVTDTLRRLRFGDGLLGWEGDPNIHLFVDTGTGLYDVWTLDEAGNPALVVGDRAYCDQRLIEDVIRSDTRRFDVLDRIAKKNERRQAHDDAERHAQMAELADKLHFALMHDLGSQVGGLTRRVH